jgi:hypothetical protein
LQHLSEFLDDAEGVHVWVIDALVDDLREYPLDDGLRAESRFGLAASGLQDLDQNLEGLLQVGLCRLLVLQISARLDTLDYRGQDTAELLKDVSVHKHGRKVILRQMGKEVSAVASRVEEHIESLNREHD